MSLSRKRFAVAPRRGHWRGRGTRFRFHLSERSVVKLSFERVFSGTRAQSAAKERCVRARSARRRGRRCRIYLRSGWLKSLEPPGDQSIRFSGRLKGRALPAGLWRVTVRAYDGEGARSALKRLSFRIVRP